MISDGICHNMRSCIMGRHFIQGNKEEGYNVNITAFVAEPLVGYML